MSELEQWCEIDGHDWIEQHLFYGLASYQKTHEIYKVCLYCRKTENLIFVPTNTNPMQTVI